MERTDNYALQVRGAKKHFLTYDQEALIAKFRLPADERYFYPTLLHTRYRLDRKNGDLERRENGAWVDGNSHSEVMTLLDLLCDSREDRTLSGKWQSMQNFGLQFHQNLLEDRRDPAAVVFDRDPGYFRERCLALGGISIPGGDQSYAIPLFDELSVCVQLWLGDEEFAPRLRYLWDENALQYLRYETMFYAVGLLLSRLTEGKCRQV